MGLYNILYSENLLGEEIFANHNILLSVEIFAIFDYCIHNRRYIEDVWILKCVLALILLMCLRSQNFTKIKSHNKLLLFGTYTINGYVCTNILAALIVTGGFGWIILTTALIIS